MEIEGQAFWVIIGMAIATYATRIGGIWLVQQFTLSKRMEAWSKAIPGSVLVAIVAPDVLTGGIAEVTAAIATVLVAWRSRNALFAMIAGVFCVWSIRTVLGISP